MSTGSTSQYGKIFLHTPISPEYFSACIELFAPSIEKYYSSDTVRNFLRGHVTTRDVDNSGQYVTDCQFVVHEPVDQTGTSRTPHVDNPVEIYAGLLYMRLPGDTAQAETLLYTELQAK